MELGHLKSALACIERALELATATSTVRAVYWLNKGKTLYRIGRYAKARSALVTAQELDPSPESAAGISACQERLNATAKSVAFPMTVIHWFRRDLRLHDNSALSAALHQSSGQIIALFILDDALLMARTTAPARVAFLLN